MGSIAGTGFTHHIAVNVVALAVFLWENFFVLKNQYGICIGSYAFMEDSG